MEGLITAPNIVCGTASVRPKGRTPHHQGHEQPFKRVALPSMQAWVGLPFSGSPQGQQYVIFFDEGPSQQGTDTAKDQFKWWVEGLTEPMAVGIRGFAGPFDA